MIQFCSQRGRLYGAEEARRIVKRRIRRRWRCVLPQGWQSVVDQAFDDEGWLRSRNGQTPGALVHDLEMECLVAMNTAAGSPSKAP